MTTHTVPLPPPVCIPEVIVPYVRLPCVNKGVAKFGPRDVLSTPKLRVQTFDHMRSEMIVFK